MGPLDWLDRWVKDPGLVNDEDLERKKSWVVAMLSIALLLIFAAISSATSPVPSYSVSLYCGLLTALLISGAVSVPCTRMLPQATVNIITCLGGVLILVIDYGTLGTISMWTAQVINMDVILVYGAHRCVAWLIVSLTCLYLTVRGFLGNEFWGAAWNHERFIPFAAPTVDTRLAIAMFMVSITTFVGDYLVTRSFADQLRQQCGLVQASQQVTEKLTEFLATYNVEAARGLVEGEAADALPPKLRNLLLQLVRNLESYKPYLPQSCLPAVGDGIESQVHEASMEQQVLPQLSCEPIRGAVQTALTLAEESVCAQMNELLSERLEACLAAGDLEGAQRLRCMRWRVPAHLAKRLKAALSGSPRPRAPPSDSPRPPLQRAVTRLSISTAADIAPGQSVTRVSIVAGMEGKPGQDVGKFGDGADSPDPPISHCPLWSAEYAPPPAREVAIGLQHWHDAMGYTFWSGATIEQLVADHYTLYGSKPGETHVALYLYTAGICEQVVWAGWRGNAWKIYRPQGLVMRGGCVLVETEAKEKFGLETTSCELPLLLEAPCGLRVYGDEGQPRLLRYENVQRGNPELSPLNDTVLWAPRPDSILSAGSLFSYARSGRPPPTPGVLEFITSRDYAETLRHRDWESHPMASEPLENLRDRCLAQKNQKRPKEGLCQRAKELFCSTAQDLGEWELTGAAAGQVAAALPALYQAKCPAASPTPAEIAHACELGVLRWRGQGLLVALTGGPRVAVPLADGEAPCRAEVLWKLSDDLWPGQPYYLMNSAMRSEHSGRHHAQLEIEGFPTIFEARQPLEPPPEPAAALFVGEEGVTAQWAGDSGWAVTVVGMAVRSEVRGQLRPEAWGLSQYRALIWHIDADLRAIPRELSGGTRRKGYRGLSGVTLDRAVYSRGRIVSFTAFTSTSDDQGVASGFTMGDAAAVVFTMFTLSGRSVSPYSRFGREKEVLLPPNTLHLVTEALSAEHAAIVNKETLQVFDLREVTMAEAVGHLAKEGALAMSREYPSMLRLAARATASAERGDWVGALRELLADPNDVDARGQQGRFVRSIVPKNSVGVVALILSSPAGPELGPGVEPGQWNDFFERAEKAARRHGARLMATQLGHITAQLTQPGAVATAQAAVALANELLCPPASVEEAPSSPDVLSSPASPAALRYLVRNEPAALSPVSAQAGGAESALRAHCGVTVGTVHGGFGGSEQHRVEIADGPAVRRALRMAAYSRRYGVSEVITDTACADAASSGGYTAWTVDLVSFDAHRDLREPISCIAPLEQSSSPSRRRRGKRLRRRRRAGARRPRAESENWWQRC